MVSLHMRSQYAERDPFSTTVTVAGRCVTFLLYHHHDFDGADPDTVKKCVTFLLDQHHLTAAHKVTGLQTVQVDSA